MTTHNVTVQRLILAWLALPEFTRDFVRKHVPTVTALIDELAAELPHPTRETLEDAASAETANFQLIDGYDKEGFTTLDRVRDRVFDSLTPETRRRYNWEIEIEPLRFLNVPALAKLASDELGLTLVDLRVQKTVDDPPIESRLAAHGEIRRFQWMLVYQDDERKIPEFFYDRDSANRYLTEQATRRDLLTLFTDRGLTPEERAKCLGFRYEAVTNHYWACAMYFQLHEMLGLTGVDADCFESLNEYIVEGKSNDIETMFRKHFAAGIRTGGQANAKDA